MEGSQSMDLGSRKASAFALHQSGAGILSPIMERTMESNKTKETTLKSNDDRQLTGIGFYDLSKV